MFCVIKLAEFSFQFSKPWETLNTANTEIDTILQHKFEFVKIKSHDINLIFHMHSYEKLLIEDSLLNANNQMKNFLKVKLLQM